MYRYDRRATLIFKKTLNLETITPMRAADRDERGDIAFSALRAPAPESYFAIKDRNLWKWRQRLRLIIEERNQFVSQGSDELLQDPRLSSRAPEDYRPYHT